MEKSSNPEYIIVAKLREALIELRSDKNEKARVNHSKRLCSIMGLS